MSYHKAINIIKPSLDFFLKILKKLVVAIIFAIVIYLVAAIIFSIIPVNRKNLPQGEIDIFIKTNGVHLDIVLPLRNELKDWSEDLHINNRIESLVNYVSFGWGDKGFFINAPRWSDLTFSTAFKALFRRSPTAIHVDYYRILKVNKKCRKISISKEQYLVMVDYIEKSFRSNKNGEIILIEGLNYWGYDCFYEAKGSYNLFFTCNSWTNKALEVAGLRASSWTPFDKGTLFQYRKQN